MSFPARRRHPDSGVKSGWEVGGLEGCDPLRTSSTGEDSSLERPSRPTPHGGRGRTFWRQMNITDYMKGERGRKGKHMASGKVDIPTNQKTGKSRLRFYGAAPEQVEIIMAALEQVRQERGTAHDTVALEAMCM